jgi:hypothetical protein
LPSSTTGPQSPAARKRGKVGWTFPVISLMAYIHGLYSDGEFPRGCAVKFGSGQWKAWT